jgi:hypothetical protein|tara:strand:- start:1314 stop:1646 length:333 start_codon:yes stop_codon:yes gene_type:complete
LVIEKPEYKHDRFWITGHAQSVSAVTFHLYNTLPVDEPLVDHTALSAAVFSQSLQRDGVSMDAKTAAGMFATPIDISIRDNLTYFERCTDTFADCKRRAGSAQIDQQVCQ